ncbi:hypothetical protein [Nitrososphaera sp.]|uniref:hypothetical protein n=1 Tax=Nitrososphaera sp. TaxID=1971748 RepID=UPI00307E92B9
MTEIYSIKPSSGFKVVLERIWGPGGGTRLGNDGGGGRYTSFAALRAAALGRDSALLLAYNKATQKADAFTLSDSSPWVQDRQGSSDIVLEEGPWDTLDTFVLGNNPYLMAYRRNTGTFGFYQVESKDDNVLSVSRPYIFELTRKTPTQGFTTVAPFASLGRQYFLGYDFDTGTVANFAVSVTLSSADGVPPLRAQNIWYHQWSNGWTHFAFFQLGGANFFFKINTVRRRINIDHINDDPSQGANEVGNRFGDQLPDAFSLSAVARVPWRNGEPHLLTYSAAAGSAAVYRVHADCRGMTKAADQTVQKNATGVVPYRAGNDSFVLFYGGGGNADGGGA